MGPRVRHPLLVRNNPENRTIVGCPNYGATIKPCVTTLAVQQGYSGFIKIGGNDACLDSVTASPTGPLRAIVKYAVRNPGQHYVGASS